MEDSKKVLQDPDSEPESSIHKPHPKQPPSYKGARHKHILVAPMAPRGRRNSDVVSVPVKRPTVTEPMEPELTLPWIPSSHHGDDNESYTFDDVREEV